MNDFPANFVRIVLVIAITILFHSVVVAQTSETEESLPSDSSRSNAVPPTNQNQSNGYIRPTTKKRISRFANDAFGVNALIGSGIGATFETIVNAPPEWKKTGGGFGRRFASDYAENAIQESVTFGLNEAFKLDDHFYKSNKRGFKARFKDAFLSSFTARTSNGKRVFNFNRIVGTYAGSFIATEAWYPNRFNYKDGFRRGSQGLAFRFGLSFINEFLIPKR
jgi:hypothetical protein